MNQISRTCRETFVRHKEAFLIIAFLAADCVLSSWALYAATLAGILFVIAPALHTVPKLDHKGRTIYIKAFVKTARFQKLLVLLFWVYSIRALLFGISLTGGWLGNSNPQSMESFSQLVLRGMSLSAPFTYVLPFLFYFGASIFPIFLRSLLAPKASDPDLVEQRKGFTAYSFATFTTGFLLGLFALCKLSDGPARWISNWLLASARDANIWSDRATSYYAPFATQARLAKDLAFIPVFDGIVAGVVALTLITICWQPLQKLTAFMTSFCWRIVNPFSLQNIVESLLETLRMKDRTLSFDEKHPFVGNIMRGVIWVLACYAGLFWLFGFCGGPVGSCIHNWMTSAATGAGIGTNGSPPSFIFHSNFRIFLGSVAALYATAPLAISSAVFLPFSRPRKITLNSDYISFFQGPYFSMLGRQTRLWSDVKDLRIVKAMGKQKHQEFMLRFASGGSVKFDESMISPRDMQVLLNALDQYAVNCVVDPEVVASIRELCANAEDQCATDGAQDADIKSIEKQEFKSTVFVPHNVGDFLPGTKIRIVKQLGSKPLCAIYLAREESGKLLTVKQFYLADDSPESKAFEKILQREYELLSKLEHPSIAKVFSAFTNDKSTYLMVEHRIGVDLREMVDQNGPRSESIVVDYAQQLAKTMTFLHTQDPVILHRDLTPDNVIAGEDGQLRLIDFGAAREYLEGITGTMIGKQCYVAPEQLRGDATVQSDIYSFGCTLYYLSTGRDPKALSQSSPAAVIECSEEMNKLIQDCTNFDAEARPKSFDEISERLKTFQKNFKIKLPGKKEKVPA
ncbi:MAG TPA: serine/threonine-protein kinase [Drouetiella sp.]